MNFKLSTLIWVLFLASGFLGLYMVKYKVQSVKSEVAAAERQLLEEKKNLHVLEAEWSYLIRPERLTQLSGKYLELTRLSGQQLTHYAQLPISAPTLARAAVTEKTVAQKPAPRSSIALASGAPHGR